MARKYRRNKASAGGINMAKIISGAAAAAWRIA